MCVCIYVCLHVCMYVCTVYVRHLFIHARYVPSPRCPHHPRPSSREPLAGSQSLASNVLSRGAGHSGGTGCPESRGESEHILIGWKGHTIYRQQGAVSALASHNHKVQILRTRAAGVLKENKIGTQLLAGRTRMHGQNTTLVISLGYLWTCVGTGRGAGVDLVQISGTKQGVSRHEWMELTTPE